MGIPSGPGVGASGAPPAGDKANAVVSGQFLAVGASAPFAFYGAFNVLVWGTTVTTLTTVAGSLAAAVVSTAGLVAGQPINGKNVPAGTTIGALPGGNVVTLAIPAGAALNQILAGADATAQFQGAIWGGSIQLERSFDGGQTWLICGVGGGGQGAIYTGAALNGQNLSIVASEPELSVLYRLNCTALSAGTPFYRLSASGLAAMAWGVPPS